MVRCCHFSSVRFQNDEPKRSHLNKFQFLKLLSSLALPLAVTVFTVITTLQSTKIANANRQQDLLQAEDDQRQTFFVDYINDISRYCDKHIRNLTNNEDRLLYIRTKTLTILRKLDTERKQYLLLFLQESSLLLEKKKFSLLDGANFSGIYLSQKDCVFTDVIFSGVNFRHATFVNCIFDNVTFDSVDLSHASLTKSILYRNHFYSCQLDFVSFESSVVSETNITTSGLIFANFHQVKLDYVLFNNVNFSNANSLFDLTQMEYIDIKNSLLPNGTFSLVESIIAEKDLCTATDWQAEQLTVGIEIERCTWTTTRLNATVEENLLWPFASRAVLIDANQAELSLRVKQKSRGSGISLEIYFIGVERGVFERQHFGIGCLDQSQISSLLFPF